ncbi:DUF4870 domain-containing protein [Cronbergia sp. UHCC 0137]|uniref:DUF4870 domain-containing protein n=1 Tax=Cronbergia sp. UHCC 0137 TaxID=3110239 RepID=UPI002B2073CF|nr:DUF4870 domain-containing protein [Cronbergia sp. UHCC 0137]MEA5619331.1 DUF4870 domain-containing protein [Cronbergia sp. UHCC 0137]
MYDSDKRKLLSALCHGAIFFSTTIVSVGVPIALLLVSDDSVVKENAKESINFHFNVWLYGAILGTLFFLTGWLVLPLVVLLPLAGLGYLVHWGLTIWAIAQVLTYSDTPCRYPLIFRVF